MILKSSAPPRLEPLPLPKLSLPGCAFARAINSPMVLAGKSLRRSIAVLMVVGLVGGLALTASGRFAVKAKQAAVVCFREGDVVLDDGAPANGFTGRVRQSEFLGKRYAIEAVLPNGESIRFHHGEALAADREVSFRVPAQSLMVYPAETATP